MTRSRRRILPEQEGYFVSMTDLMIGLLFLFIIMLMSFALNYSRAEANREVATTDLDNQLDRADSAQEIAEVAQRAAEARERELTATNAGLTDNRRTLDHVLTSLKRTLQAAGVAVVVDVEKGILRLPEDVLFDSGRDELSGPGRTRVGILARQMLTAVACFAQGAPPPAACDKNRSGRLEAVYVEGHTDNVPISSQRSGRVRDNWDLSSARAKSTYYTLLQSAPELALLTNDRGEALLGVSGYGEFRPVAANDTARGREANRRIDLRFLMATPEPSR